jgi:hypothetical protein
MLSEAYWQLAFAPCLSVCAVGEPVLGETFFKTKKIYRKITYVNYHFTASK